ncbi:Transient receptor potential cation channel subfamily V member 5 [Channa argus]|uniref:Transient receptor potential cation channel subfamily V member 5 n=1 Tax=Channa argus TaxID=215402 RepID=A0A6G1QE65_CHAAH|nr:Transient receptor potential cation channel subfamily V member 5 [Channa argus]
MSPSLVTSAPVKLNRWWKQLRFRLQNKKGWNEVLDETFLLYSNLINDVPLFYAAVNNSVGSIKNLLTHASTDIYERGGFGETALHIAVMNDNLEAAVALMDGAPELVNEPMTSEFFQGNTLLHILVLQPSNMTACQVIDLIMEYDAESEHSVPLDMVPNFRGLTPFKLAAKEGNVVAFQHLVNRRQVTQWSLGPLTSNLYDLTEIDSWADNKSVLEVVVCSKHSEARKILELTPVKQLVRLKWNLYGKYYFRVLLFVYLLYISIFTACCMFRPLKPIPPGYKQPSNDKSIYMQKRLNIPDILRVGAKRYFGQTALGGPFHVILIVYAFFVVLLCVFRLSEVQDEITPMSVCLVLGWCNIMFFARGFEMLGPVVIMVQKVLFGDMLKFMWLMSIALMAFCTAKWMFDMTQYPSALPDWSSFPVSLFTMFEVDISFINLPEDQSILSAAILYVVDIAYNVVAAIVVTNVLLVMINDTYSKVTEERDELWRTQVVATILMLERRMPRRLWPRLGICGLAYGLKERWYLRVEDKDDPVIPKTRQYMKAFSKEDGRENQGLDMSDSTPGVSLRNPPDWL